MEIAAQIIGVFAMILNIWSYQQKAKNKFLSGSEYDIKG